MVRCFEQAGSLRNLNLTNELDKFVVAKVESGRYENASEIIQAALRTLEREEKEYETNCQLHTRHLGEEQTVRYIDDVEKCCQRLADNPNLGPARDTIPELHYSNHCI